MRVESSSGERKATQTPATNPQLPTLNPNPETPNPGAETCEGGEEFSGEEELDDPEQLPPLQLRQRHPVLARERERCSTF